MGYRRQDPLCFLAKGSKTEAWVNTHTKLCPLGSMDINWVKIPPYVHAGPCARSMSHHVFADKAKCPPNPLLIPSEFNFWVKIPQSSQNSFLVATREHELSCP